jgi:serine/threonine-protein kinase
VIASAACAFTTLFRDLAIEARDMDMYVLDDQIGFGGMGEIWRAEHRRLARPAAIKIIRPDMLCASPAQAARLIKRFETEARATAGLRSPHTIEVYDFGATKNGLFYYVMQYLEGFDLERMVNDFGRLPAERAVHLLRQVAEALADAHDQGLIHRDVKPANIFVARMGRRVDFVKVLDFGLVKEIRGAPEDTALRSDVGEVTGTPAYLAPEAITAEGAPDHRVDIYALGCVAYFAVTGELVFVRATPMATVVAHATERPALPSVHVPVPPELERIIMRCLAKDPDDRYADAGALCRDLERCAAAIPWDADRARAWWNAVATAEPTPATRGAA